MNNKFDFNKLYAEKEKEDRLEEISYLREVVKAREGEIKDLKKQIEDNAEEDYLDWMRLWEENYRLRSILNAANPDQKVLVITHYDYHGDETSINCLPRSELENYLIETRYKKCVDVEIWTNKLDIQTSIRYKFRSVDLIEEKENDRATEEDSNDEAGKEALEEDGF